jgi:predicted metal-binding protein
MTKKPDKSLSISEEETEKIKRGMKIFEEKILKECERTVTEIEIKKAILAHKTLEKINRLVLDEKVKEEIKELFIKQANQMTSCERKLANAVHKISNVKSISSYEYDVKLFFFEALFKEKN